MQNDQLLELRNKIVQSAQQVALHGEGSEAERLQLLLGIIRGGDATIEVLTKAYELSQSIEGDEDKLSTLLYLLYEVDIKLGESESKPAIESHSDQPVEQHVEQHDQQPEHHE